MDNEPLVEVELRGSVGPRGGPLYGPGRALVPASLARSLGMAGMVATVEVPQSRPPTADGGAPDARDIAVLDLPIRELTAALQGIDDLAELGALEQAEIEGKGRRGALDAIAARIERIELEDGS